VGNLNVGYIALYDIRSMASQSKAASSTVEAVSVEPRKLYLLYSGNRVGNGGYCSERISIVDCIGIAIVLPREESSEVLLERTHCRFGMRPIYEIGPR